MSTVGLERLVPRSGPTLNLLVVLLLEIHGLLVVWLVLVERLNTPC